MNMFHLRDALYAANELGILFQEFSIQDLLQGMNIELEHGKKNSLTNITNDDSILTAKIALAHLLEYPNYYNSEYGILSFEKMLKGKLNEMSSSNKLK